MNEKIAFIGGGNMTRAIVQGLVDSGFDPRRIAVAEPLEAARRNLVQDFSGLVVLASNDEAAAHADCVVLAVKPQVLAGVCRALAGTIQAQQPLVVSIAAGVRSDDIEDWLGGSLAVVRVMPNQPALLAKGVSGLYANKYTSSEQVELARSVMEATGVVVTVDTEDAINVVTAVSGSGPAYFYYLIDILASTGESLGLPRDVADTLARETARGSALLAADSSERMETLIGRVRSPGGTTAAALDSLDNDDARAIFAAAITAACDRAAVLAEEAHSQSGQD